MMPIHSLWASWCSSQLSDCCKNRCFFRVSCVMSALPRSPHRRENVHCEIKGWFLLHSAWVMLCLSVTGELGNEITAAFHHYPRFAAMQSVLRHWSSSKAGGTKSNQTELPPAFQPVAGILLTWQTSDSGVTTNSTPWKQKERASVPTKPSLSHSFPPTLTSDGWGVSVSSYWKLEHEGKVSLLPQ